MGLTKSQQTIWERARALGAGDMGVALSDEMCAYLVGRIALDLGLGAQFGDVPAALPAFFDEKDPRKLTLAGDARKLFERLVAARQDADTYFACLASLQKARLKYSMILGGQPLPTLEQVGPRGLLQFGQLSPRALSGLLFWRKWFFDIDNRAGQETGYLFEPVIAHAIGGTPAPSKKSPVKRHKDGQKGRQVDCILTNAQGIKRAYEFKIRVTIAASGQGRWREELDFPIDCKQSGFVPVLVCLDGTSNPKLDELKKAFLAQGGEVHTGAEAWAHLEGLAGATMSQFLRTYIRGPIKSLIDEAPTDLPDFTVTASVGFIRITVGGEMLEIRRESPIQGEDAGDSMPGDAAGDIEE